MFHSWTLSLTCTQKRHGNHIGINRRVGQKMWNRLAPHHCFKRYTSINMHCGCFKLSNKPLYKVDTILADRCQTITGINCLPLGKQFTPKGSHWKAPPLLCVSQRSNNNIIVHRKGCKINLVVIVGVTSYTGILFWEIKLPGGVVPLHLTKYVPKYRLI